jgi:hypothetical protein
MQTTNNKVLIKILVDFNNTFKCKINTIYNQIICLLKMITNLNYNQSLIFS